MGSQGSRLKEFMTLHGLSNAELGRMMGVSPQSITNWRSGINDISLRNAEKMCALFPGLSLDWLIRGDGQMYPSDKHAARHSSVSEPHFRYFSQPCSGCMERDAEIRYLTTTIQRLEEKIDQLNREIGKVSKTDD